MQVSRDVIFQREPWMTEQEIIQSKRLSEIQALSLGKRPSQQLEKKSLGATSTWPARKGDLACSFGQ